MFSWQSEPLSQFALTVPRQYKTKLNSTLEKNRGYKNIYYKQQIEFNKVDVVELKNL